MFKLDKDGRNYQTLRNFAGGPGDGVRSRSRLAPGAPGLFYSATLNGGSSGLGVVFQLAIPDLARFSARPVRPTSR